MEPSHTIVPEEYYLINDGIHNLQVVNIPLLPFVDFRKVQQLISRFIPHQSFKLTFYRNTTFAQISIGQYEFVVRLMTALDNYEWHGQILRVFNNSPYMINPPFYNFNWYMGGPYNQFLGPPQINPNQDSSLNSSSPIFNEALQYPPLAPSWRSSISPKKGPQIKLDSGESERKRSQLEIRDKDEELGKNNPEEKEEGKEQKIDPCKLFIGNIPFASTWRNLKDYLKNGGVNIRRVEIPMNSNSNGIETSKGFAIVHTDCEEDSLTLISMFNEKEFEGRTLTVRFDRFPEFNNYNLNSVSDSLTYNKNLNHNKTNFLNYFSMMNEWNYYNYYNSDSNLNQMTPYSSNPITHHSMTNQMINNQIPMTNSINASNPNSALQNQISGSMTLTNSSQLHQQPLLNSVHNQYHYQPQFHPQSTFIPPPPPGHFYPNPIQFNKFGVSNDENYSEERKNFTSFKSSNTTTSGGNDNDGEEKVLHAKIKQSNTKVDKDEDKVARDLMISMNSLELK